MDLIGWGLVLFKVGFYIAVMMTLVAFMTWVERRGAGLISNRLGPNRVGPLGLLQPVADGIKFLFKEDRTPGHVRKFYFFIAPLVCFVPAMMAFAVIPLAAPVTLGGFFGGRVVSFQVVDLSIGLLFALAVTSTGGLGVVLAGWSSNNKYSLLGALRAIAQRISYELSLGLAVVAAVLVYSSVDLAEIAQLQASPLFSVGPVVVVRWGFLLQPVGFLVFLITAFAETNRLPFDLPEGESELVAGYHIEYGSMKWSMFYLSEYMNMITAAGLLTTLYFGGWQPLPGLGAALRWLFSVGTELPVLTETFRVAVHVLSFSIKMAFFLWFFVWVRWTFPRFRYDQLMRFGWKVLLPLSLLNVLVTASLIYGGVF